MAEEKQTVVVTETTPEPVEPAQEPVVEATEHVTEAAVEVAHIESDRDKSIAETVQNGETERAHIAAEALSHAEELEQCRTKISSLQTSLEQMTLRAETAEAETVRLSTPVQSMEPEPNPQELESVEPTQVSPEGQEEPVRPKRLHRWI